MPKAMSGPLYVVLVVLALTLAACQPESAEPEVAVDVEALRDDLVGFEETITALEERVTALEENATALEDRTAGNDVNGRVDIPGPDILVNLGSYVDQRVTVSAAVEQILTTSAFTLDTLQGPVLVVDASGAGNSELVQEDAVVNVEGIVHEDLSTQDVEQGLGVQLEDHLFMDFAGEYYIVASDINEPAATE